MMGSILDSQKKKNKKKILRHSMMIAEALWKQPIKLASMFFLSNFNLCEMFVCAAQSHCLNVLALAVGVLEAQLKKNLSTPHQLFMGGLGRDLCWLYVLVLSV